MDGDGAYCGNAVDLRAITCLKDNLVANIDLMKLRENAGAAVGHDRMPSQSNVTTFTEPGRPFQVADTLFPGVDCPAHPIEREIFNARVDVKGWDGNCIVFQSCDLLAVTWDHEQGSCEKCKREKRFDELLHVMFEFHL